MKTLGVGIVGFLSFLLIMGLLSSCCKTVACKPGFASISFVGFNNSEIREFYLRRYRINTNFSSKIDTVIYRIGENLTYAYVIGGRDTIEVIPSSVTPAQRVFFIEAGYDYELVLPATGQVSRITEVAEQNYEQTFCGFAKPECNTVISSVKVNGVIFSGTAIIMR